MVDTTLNCKNKRKNKSGQW